MKKFIAIFGLIGILFTAGCTGHTEYGECVGIQEINKENPKLEYHVLPWNVIWTVIGVETVFAPLVFLLCDTECPTGYINPQPATK